MSARYPWSALGLDGPSQSKEIRRAYAVRLREINRDDPAIFQQLVAARDHALKQAKAKTARPSLQNIAEMGTTSPRINVEQADISVPKNEAPEIIVQKQASPKPDIPSVDERAPPQFWAKPTKTLVEELKEHIDYKNWKTIADKFQDDSISMSFEERTEIERYLYKSFMSSNEISEVVKASSSPIETRQTAIFTVLEEEFEWLSDTLSASKRLGVYNFDAGILAALRDLRLRRAGRFVPSKSTSSGSGFHWGYFVLIYFGIKIIIKLAEQLGQ